MAPITSVLIIRFIPLNIKYSNIIGRVLVRQIKEMYTENIEYLSSSPTLNVTFKGVKSLFALMHWMGVLRYVLAYSVHLLIVAYLHFQIITKGDRNLEWQDFQFVEHERLFHLPFYTCYFTAPHYTFTMKEIIDQGLLTWEDGGKSGPFPTVMRMSLFQSHYKTLLTSQLKEHGISMRCCAMS